MNLEVTQALETKLNKHNNTPAALHRLEGTLNEANSTRAEMLGQLKSTSSGSPVFTGTHECENKHLREYGQHLPPYLEGWVVTALQPRRCTEVISQWE